MIPRSSKGGGSRVLNREDARPTLETVGICEKKKARSLCETVPVRKTKNLHPSRLAAAAPGHETEGEEAEERGVDAGLGDDGELLD